MTTSGTLAYSLSNVYRYYLGSLVDDHQARIFARDWPSNTSSLSAAIRRVGSAVWWQARERYHEDDRTPFVVASVDPATGCLRFDVATADQVRGLPAADRFAWDGGPLDG